MAWRWGYSCLMTQTTNRPVKLPRKLWIRFLTDFDNELERTGDWPQVSANIDESRDIKTREPFSWDK